MPEAVREIPLRLNKRRDGSLCLTDALGRGTGDAREFPPVHVFGYQWVANVGSDVARIEDGEVTLTLANATARYRVVDEGPTAVRGELIESSLSDPPAIDEDKAGAIAARRADRVESGTAERSEARAGSIHISVDDVADAGDVLGRE